MNHEKGSLSWAGFWAEKSRAAMEHPNATFEVQWRTPASGNAGLYFINRANQILSPVPYRVPYLTSWTIKTSAPKLLGSCVCCGSPFYAAVIRHECQKDYCVECFEHTVDVMSEGAPDPTVEDIPIEDFIVYRRRAQAGGYEAEIEFEASIKCFLYCRKDKGFDESCAPVAWRSETGSLYTIRPSCDLPGDWIAGLSLFE